jgi:PAS domain S-box-containing protein
MPKNKSLLDKELTKKDLKQKIRKLQKENRGLREKNIKLEQQNRSKINKQKNLEATLHSLGDGVIITDPESRILSMNTIAEELTGWREKEASGQPVHDIFNIVNAKTREIADNPVEKVLKYGKIVGLANHTTLIAKDGTEYQIADSGFPIEDEDGNIKGVALVFRDVTEKYRIRESLQKSEEMYRTIFENTGTATIIIEEDTTISLANKKFEKLTGYSKEEIENKMGWPEFVVEADHDRLQRYHEKRRQNRFEAPNQYETSIMDKENKLHNIIVNIDVIPNTNKSVASFSDITKLKKAKAEIEHQKKMLHRLNIKIINAQEEERKKISKELHDDMGQNLTAISINLSTMKQQVAEKCNSGTMARLEESMEIVDLISDRIHQMVYKLRPSILDDLGLIRTIKWYVNRYKKRTRIPVEVHTSNINGRYKPQLEIILYRIIQEALTNITKHAHADKVKISIVENTKALNITIKDNGQGFNPESLSFDSLSNGGMGIPGIRERLLEVEGQLQIDSEPGRGTKLLITIPKGMTK